MGDIDIIVDVILDGRVLNPEEIPSAVTTVIDGKLANGDMTPGEIEHQGTRYMWSVRPCVYP